MNPYADDIFAATPGKASPQPPELPPASPVKQITVLSFKTAANLDNRNFLDAEVDMQGISETWAHEPQLGESLWSVQMIHLLKGTRRKDKSGRYITSSPLSTGFKKFIGEWQYAPKFVHSTWGERFFVWEEMGSKEWVDSLEAGEHFPTKEDQPVIDQLYKIPSEVYRDPVKINQWATTTGWAEARWHQELGLHNENPGLFPVLEAHTRSCVWPTRCQYFRGCHETTAWDDKSVWVERIPHHLPENLAETDARDGEPEFHLAPGLSWRDLLKLAGGREIVWLDRSRVLQRHRCPLSRFLEYHAYGTGIRAKAQAIPLVTGIVTHVGLAELLKGSSEDSAVEAAVGEYDEICRDFGLREDEWDETTGEPITEMATPFTVLEQRTLAEGMIRMANRRIKPWILDRYKVVSVEAEVCRVLHETPKAVFVWMARTDGLLERKTRG